MAVPTNPYELLGVSRDAGLDELMSAFRDKVRILGETITVTDPAYGRELHALRQAVHTLTDPERRKQLDATLPPPGAAASAVPADLKMIWSGVSKLFFERTNRFTPAFDALRASVPLTMEGDNLLIVGIDPAHGSLAAYLNTVETHAMLRRLLGEVAKRPLDFRIVNTTSLQEWITLRDPEGKTPLRGKTAVKPPAPAEPPAAPPAPADAPAGDSWDAVMEGIMRVWSNTDGRNFPQVRAKIVSETLQMILRAEDAARAARQADEQLQRALGRALDRVGSVTGIDSGVIALEYLHLREHTKPGGGQA